MELRAVIGMKLSLSLHENTLESRGEEGLTGERDQWVKSRWRGTGSIKDSHNWVHSKETKNKP